MRSLVWFRSDLRVDDNPALRAGVEAADDGVLAVFFCTPDQWLRQDWGTAKVDFVIRGVAALSAALERLGIALLVEIVPTYDEIAERLVALSREHRCDRLFCNREYEPWERRRDRMAARALEKTGSGISFFDDQTVVPPGRLNTGKGSPYTVFTPFRRAWSRRLEERGLPEPQPAPAPVGRLVRRPDPVPEAITGFEPDPALTRLWTAGEEESHRRLADFAAHRLRHYRRDRDLAATDGTSRISPYLAAGVLSIRRCLAAAVSANQGRLRDGEPGIDTWISELVWRDFYRHVMVGYPRVGKNRAFKVETEAIPWRRDEAQFEAWCAGRTGVPFVDAGMRQLAATGWMHNRLRMVTAMFLTKDLLLDWRLGERLFMRRLVDADLASNNGGWQWSASTGTDAAPYFRIFNPWTQGKRYDPEGDFIRRWVPELSDCPAAALHDPAKLTPVERAALGYPMPLVDHRTARIRAMAAFQKLGAA